MSRYFCNYFDTLQPAYIIGLWAVVFKAKKGKSCLAFKRPETARHGVDDRGKVTIAADFCIGKVLAFLRAYKKGRPL